MFCFSYSHLGSSGFVSFVEICDFMQVHAAPKEMVVTHYGVACEGNDGQVR
jgi:hypothetical protein